MKLQNKKAVVTGGSRGIGKAIAAAFLAEGAEVLAIARSSEELAALSAELGASGRLTTATGDVTNEEDMKRIAGLAGTVDILVNAAGVYGPIGRVTDVDSEAWLGAVKVNLFGTFLATKYFAPLIQAGSILNFVGGGEGAYPNFSSYVAAKGGIARFTETVAAELAPIRVNAISPGPVNTKFVDDLIAAGPEKAGQAAYDRALKQKETGGTPPDKAAALAVFLAGSGADGITGRIISAEWTPYEKLPEHLAELQKSDVYQMRKILPKDRGFTWEDR
jgi:NAD(P)-dependent dehydrogenase (short-subunit alcohol dehydrogenase family)